MRTTKLNNKLNSNRENK